jgi:hypothetical protein
MGCNLHGYLEVMEYPETEKYKWFSVHNLPFTRSYWFYAALAGVRNYIEINPISKPKGMPEDASIMSQIECEEDGGDGHSHSWLTATELLNYEWNQKIKTSDSDETILCDSLHTHFKALLTEVAYLATQYGSDRVRMVFWFDN